MRIAYIGRITLPALEARFEFDHELPDVRWGFPLGTEIVLGLVARGHHVSVIATDNNCNEIRIHHTSRS